MERPKIRFRFQLFIFTFWFLNFEVQAQFFKKEDFQVAVGGQFNSLLQKRGMITYEGYQVIPIYAVQLWNPQLLLAGSALYFTQPLTSKQHFVRFRLNVDSTLDQPLYYTSESKDDRVRREVTSELDLFYEIHSQGGSHLRLLMSKDLVASHGFYSELYTHVALYDLYTNSDGKVILQPGLFASLGMGNRNHNTYLYGSGAGDFGLTNIQYGFSVISPGVIDAFWPTLRISRFELVGDRTRSASLVKEREGWSVEMLFAFRVY